MNRSWTPESRVSVTEAGMVIKIRLSAIQASRVIMSVDGDQLSVRGQHDNFDLESFVKRAIKQGEQMLKKKCGRL